jgi:hypothetical protein
MRKTTVATLAVLALIVLAGTGCTRVRLDDAPSTKTTTESRTVGLEGATSVDAEIVMGAGELSLSAEPSATEVLKADFAYSPPDWKPEVSYTVNGAVGKLDVRQPQSSSHALTFREMKNMWDLALTGAVPMTLDLTLGVGTSNVDLRGLDLVNGRKIGLTVLCGVGNSTIDLSGRPRPTDLSARIETGIGETVIRLPRSVGVRVSGREDGIGSTTADGLIARGDSWVNEAYAGTGPKIEIDLFRGIGDVTLELVD